MNIDWEEEMREFIDEKMIINCEKVSKQGYKALLKL